VELADGRSVFVKHALTPEAEGWLRLERNVYEHVHAPFMPGYLGAHDDGEVAIVLEDLAAAERPPPWSPERIDAVLETLAALRAVEPPSGLPLLDDMRDHLVGWSRVRDDPGPLLSTAICTREWLDSALPTLLEAAEAAQLAGSELLHADVRSDNLFLRDGVAVLVDWNLACVGNGLFDVAFWLPSLRLEDGPEPWEVLADAAPLAAAVAGFFAARAGLPAPEGAPTVRAFQLKQLEVALPWAARELGLPPVV
jgi:aminoglycoside phosphotransferase (APT) family kinase protein